MTRPRGIVVFRVFEIFLLCPYLEAGTDQIDQLVHPARGADQTDRDDHVADFLTLLDTLCDVGTLAVESDQNTAARVDDRTHIAAGRFLQIGGGAQELARRLTREYGEALQRRQVRQVFAVRHDRERTDPHDRRGGRLTVGLHDRVLVLLHVAGCGHLALHLEPETLQLANRR
jgi:hypothetical protein